MFGKKLQHHGCVIHARKSRRNNSRNNHSCMYSKLIVIGFQISSFVCVWLVFIDAAVLFVIITLHMRIAIYEANMGHLQIVPV